MSRVVFLGTPGEAVPSLLAVAHEADVGLVITQPDRPRGRNQQVQPTPVKAASVDLGLRVAQPESADQLFAAISDAGPFDVGVVVAYGRIIQRRTLDLSSRGMLNLHFSLLPRWRGAAPVERALMAGDSMSGITVIRLDEGLDTGPVLTAQAIDIGHEFTGGMLRDQLARAGAALLAGCLGPYLDDTLQPVPQVDEGVTYAKKLQPEDRAIRLDDGVLETVNRVRALSPDPAARLGIDGDTYKILEVSPSTESPQPGTWVTLDSIPVFGTHEGGIEIRVLQPPGKTPRTGEEWLRGLRRDSGLVSEGSR